MNNSKSPKNKAMKKRAPEKSPSKVKQNLAEHSKFEKSLKSKTVKFDKKKANNLIKSKNKDKALAKESISSLPKDEGDSVVKAGEKRKREKSLDKNSDGSDTKKPKLEELTVKERRKQRKSAKNNYDISTKAKKLWDILRREDCPKAKQIELSNEVYNLVQGKVDPLVFAHDTARVIECLMICGTPDLRNKLFEETKDKLVKLMKSKYSKFFVLKLLKYGTKEQRGCVMKAMYKKVVKLMLHTEAAEVVELAYNDYANVHQRAMLAMEFYGPAFALFKEKEVSSLNQLIENEPLNKENTLQFMKDTINSIVQKSVIRHSIVHHVILEYLNNCEIKDREEMILTLRDKVVEILHTKEGSRIGLQCIWHGTSKDRKVIVKSMKTHAVKISQEENGHIVLLAIFDCVDDTKLVQKVLLEEILTSGLDLILHPTGRKVLLYLIAPRDTIHFHPDVINILSKGDGNTTSKKETSVRRSELLSTISDSIFKLASDNVEKLIACPGACLFLQTAMKNCEGDLSNLFTKIAEICARPLTNTVGEIPHIVESGAGHRVLKKIIQEDKKRNQKNAVRFSEILLETVTDESLCSWIECNRGSFILLALIESEVVPVIKRVAVALKPVMDVLRKKKFKGAELLHLKLKSLDQ